MLQTSNYTSQHCAQCVGWSIRYVDLMWSISYIEHTFLSGVWKRFFIEMDTTTIHVIMRLDFICAHNTNNMLWVQFIYNEAHVVVVGVYERWTHVQPTFQKENVHMPKTFPKQTCHKERGNKCGKVGE